MPYYDTVTHVWETKMVVPTTGWTLISYNGSSNAKSRKYLGIFNRSERKIYITTDNTSNPAHTRAIKAGGERIFPYSDKVSIYGQALGGGATIVVTEECG